MEGVEDAVRFRAEFGLRSDAAFVRGTLTSPESFPDHSWGVPLSVAEAADLQERVLATEASQAAVNIAVETEGYAGVYFDQLRHGLAVFLFTDVSPERTSAVVEALPDDIDYELRQVARSERELLAIKSQIVSEEKQLEALGISDIGVGIDVTRNAVYLSVPELDETKAAILRDRYDGAVVVEPQQHSTADACTGVQHCYPLKGGLRIYETTESQYKCTLGFLGKRTNSGTLVGVTAGHCLSVLGNGVDDDWGHSITPANSANWGGELSSTWASGADADVGLIQLDTQSIADLSGVAKNLLLTEEPSAIYNVKYVRSNATQSVGTPICRNGWGSGYEPTWGDGDTTDCGTIVNPIDFRRPSEAHGTTYLIDHTWTVSFDSAPGDSGGPMFLTVGGASPYAIAFGTHVHSEDNPGGTRGWYSPIQWGITTYDQNHSYTYSLCLTTTC